MSMSAMRTGVLPVFRVLLPAICLISGGFAKPMHMPLPDYPDTVIATITTGGWPIGPAATLDGQYVYVPGFRSDSIYVIRASDNAIVARFAMAGRPTEAKPSPDGQYMYISNTNGANVTKVRLADNQIVHQTQMLSDPLSMAFVQNNERMYVTIFRARENHVAVLRTADDSLLQYITVGSDPWGIAATADGQRCYVSCAYSDTVYVLRTSDNTVESTIPVEGNPHGIALSPAEDLLYVACKYAPDLKAPNHPTAVVLPTHQTHAAYQGNQCLKVIRLSDQSVVATVPLADPPGSLALLPNGEYLYISSYGFNSVTIIRTADFSVVKTVTTGYASSGLAVLPDGSAVYVSAMDEGCVRVIGNVDVGPVAILSPAGTVDSGNVYQPRAVVRNFGPASATFPVWMVIGAGYTQMIQETLASRLTDTVVFPSWTAGPVGSLPVTCFTSLAGDEDRTNDTIRDSVRVVGPSPGDVGPISILSPPQTAESGVVYVPTAAVRNFGLTPAVFPVTMDIGAGYIRAVVETLTVGLTDTVVFPPWTAEPVGPLTIACYTSLAGDEDATNDTIRDSVRVLRVPVNDVGATAILSPSGAVDSGSVFVPSAVVRNFGLTPAVFPVTMNIGTGYAETANETLASGLEDTLVFPPWTAGPMGTLPITCFTSLLGDEDSTNDTIVDSVQVLPPPRHDVGAIAIVSPSGSVRAGDTVVPKARIRNFGNRVERYFDVQFQIGTSFNEKVNVADALLSGSAAELAFPPWVAEAGDWAISCSTMLGSDVDSANDRVSSSVRVFPQSLAIEPDQSDRIEAGQSWTYRFYALIQGDTGGVVEVARPSAPSGWSLRLGNATGADDLTDTDGDGIPDLGYVAPGDSRWFSLDVTARSGTQGDTASLGQVTIPVAGHVAGRTDIADTAVLNLTLLPAFSVHNFPNPFSTNTSFVVGLPDDGKASLTIYTRAGERVCRVLENTNLTAGVHVERWDAVNDNGRRVAPGTYEYLLDYVHQGITDRIRKKLVVTRE